MSVLKRIANFQNRRDDVPNRELAKELAETKDRNGIREIAENLWNENQNVQSDCVKVLYEIGYLNPELIADYVVDFLKLIKSKDNRLVWGGMLALSTTAGIKSKELYLHIEEIKCVLEQGSVITRDNGVKILATIASSKAEYRERIFPYLLEHLETCRLKDVPQHAESIVVAVNARNKNEFIQVLEKRMVDMNGPQATRLKKVIKGAEKRSAN
jgi:hypothetical protein